MTSNSAIIGIAGTAKNTGKTTTLNALLQHSHSQNITIGVTSIGYDGEEIDNITSLPKPRIFLHRGMIASTSAQCIPENGWTQLHSTGLFTALGEIVIVQCETAGLIVLAGPNKRSELETVVRLMEGFGCSNIFVDGSLNRIAPMSVVDKIIFTTGAARTTDIPVLVEEMKAIEFLFQFGKSQWRNKQEKSQINVILSPDSKITPHEIGTKNPVFVRGFITSTELRTLVENIQLMPDEDRPHEIIFPDPITLLLSGEPQRTSQLIAQLTGLHIIISYQKPIRLAAVTVNPFYPEYRGTTYTQGYVDATILLSSTKSSLTSPCFNILQTNIAELYDCSI